ncbi:MAG: hypothetical protein K0B02_04675 [DPANN group archaeon]|nr:hypothetical protein [DPANN group archaeon]
MDAKSTSLSEVKDFLKPSFQETFFYVVEGPVSFLSGYGTLLIASIVGESLFWCVPALFIPQALTYVGMRGSKVYGYLFEKETPLAYLALSKPSSYNMPF